MRQHDQFQELLDALVKHSGSGVGQEVLGEVMARTSLRGPEDASARRSLRATRPPGVPPTSTKSPGAPSAKQ